jgi:hypothetical protein
MTRAHITIESKNQKTGPIPVTTTGADTCPDACPLKKNGCYADAGPLGLHWRAVSDGRRGISWDELCETIAALPDNQLWRHNQAGDLPGHGDAIDPAELGELVRANIGRRGFTYTHKPATPENLKWIAAANEWGFTVNLSANDLAHADALADTGAGPVVTLLPADIRENTVTPAGRRVVICPAETRDDVTCASCQLCSRANRKTIVGFPAHGPSQKRAQAVFFMRAAA